MLLLSAGNMLIPRCNGLRELAREYAAKFNLGNTFLSSFINNNLFNPSSEKNRCHKISGVEAVVSGTT